MNRFRAASLAMLAAAAGVAAAPNTPISFGVPVTGRLEPGDEQLTSGEHFDRYVFSGSEGQQVQIRLESIEIDPYLILLHPDGNQTDNDDSRVGARETDAAIEIYLPVSGRYEILATSYLAGETGRYTLTASVSDGVTPRSTVSQTQPFAAPVTTQPFGNNTPPPPSAQPAVVNSGGGPIAVGQTAVARLMEGDPQLESGEHFDDWTLQGQSGQSLVFTLESQDFDPYLIVVHPDGRQSENDDFGGTLNSQIHLTLPITGQYRVLPTTYAQGRAGAYTLTVR